MNRPDPWRSDDVDRSLEGTLWRREGTSLVYERECASFVDAIAFVNQVAELAEAENHHPDIEISWRTVRLRLTTHQINGLSMRDAQFVEKMDF